MTHLLQIAFGPVQDFIVSARRSRDLYAGSRLLSEAAGEAAAYLADRVSYQSLIFPAPNDASHFQQLRKSGIPNVVLVQLEASADPRALAEGAIQRAREHLLQKAKDLLEPLRELIDWKATKEQVLDLLETYWACVPMLGEKDYAQARNRLAAAMAARKSTREFEPVPWGASVPKSSLDGARESVTYRASAAWRLEHGLREGEELSGVDLLKRLWPERSFLSTSHLVALPYLEGLRQKGREKEARFYLERLAGAVGQEAREEWSHPVLRGTLLEGYDPRILFAGRLREFFEAEDPRLEQAKAALVEMHRALGEPLPYYALLHADGDRMGEAIDHQSQQGEEAHRRLSNRLALGFAGKVQGIVERWKGALVYAGGDDVLALLPLHTALRCAKELAQTFARAMKGLGGHQDPTLSVGLAFVHHLEPLQDALELVRRAEKFAKEGHKDTPAGQKRNALAVAYSPRSGSERMVRGRWDETPGLGQRLCRYADLFRLEELPAKAAYELQDLLLELGGVPDMQDAVVLEAKRILGRKQMKTGYRQELDHLLQTPQDVARLADELIIAKVLAKAYEQAGVPKENPEVYDAH